MRRLTPSGKPVDSPYPNLRLPDPPPDRPFVYVNMAMTLDGKVVSGNPKAGYLLTGSEGDRRGMAELRAAADAVIIGAGTLRAENPVLSIRYDDLRANRADEGKPENPRYLVLTGSGRLDPDARMFEQPGAMVVTSVDGSRAVPEKIRAKAEILVAGEKEPDLEEALRRLRADHGVRYLLAEGGPTLTHALVARDFVDQFFVTLAPIVKSGEDTPTLVEGPAFPYDALPRFRILSISEEAGELFLRYEKARD
jgi:riboflavin-specific deaminase-like protein